MGWYQVGDMQLSTVCLATTTACLKSECSVRKAICVVQGSFTVRWTSKALFASAGWRVRLSLIYLRCTYSLLNTLGYFMLLSPGLYNFVTVQRGRLSAMLYCMRKFCCLMWVPKVSWTVSLLLAVIHIDDRVFFVFFQYKIVIIYAKAIPPEAVLFPSQIPTCCIITVGYSMPSMQCRCIFSLQSRPALFLVSRLFCRLCAFHAGYQGPLLPSLLTLYFMFSSHPMWQYSMSQI